MNRENAIHLRTVAKSFKRQDGTNTEALRNVDFQVSDQEFVCIVGPSGCGKSTLLRLLAGLIGPTHGQILISGEPILAPRRDIGIVFQNPVLLPWQTTLENILLPITIYGLKRAPALERARDLIKLVGLEGFEGSYPHELSGGMQQRVAIARALIHNPRMLLMDEPFGALDAMTRQMMNLELTRIWAADRKTVVLITHDISEAIFLGDRVLVMSARPGTIIEDIAVDLPRPRRISVVASPQFAVATRRIQRLLHLDDLIDA